jgi:uncharacterized protein YjbI with pentapeptide repeats
MANREHIAKLKKGVEEWNTWRTSNLTIIPDLRRADLRRADLRAANLGRADLSWTILERANLGGANLSSANLRQVHLSRSYLYGADLSGANLGGADLSETALGRADLSRAYLQGTNLSDADLRGANLRGANFRETNLSGADLGGTDLVEANLRGANFRGANLVGADLRGADLTWTNLRGARLGGADLRETTLYRANLSGANLCGANLSGTVFGDTNLKDVQGLNACNHLGPSVLDYRTLAKSGPLPLPFLRGCGLSDEYIKYLPSLLNQAIQFYSCFISYSTMDQAFVERLHADLQNQGVRCWFVPHDTQGGKKVHEKGDEAIRVYDRLLLIISAASLNSEWIKEEIAKARKWELGEHRRVLFPVRLVGFETLRDWECFDADTGKDSAREIRQYFIPDFSDWKNHEKYQSAFERLLKDLKAKEQ